MSKITQKKARILANLHLSHSYYRLSLNVPEIAQAAKPGQFVMLQVEQSYRPLLRRPFSINRVYSLNQKKDSKLECIDILYEIVGEGTKILSRQRARGYLDIIGPLGNGFDLVPYLNRSTPILVAGGMGVAPLFFLAQRVTELKPLVLIGAKTKGEIIFQKEFANLGLDVRISTDDGSAGSRGKVTELLGNILRRTYSVRRATIYACGSRPMLSQIARISKKYGIPAQISLDEYMACGLGVCLGCMVETEEGQKFVCKDGPVFDAAGIKW